MIGVVALCVTAVILGRGSLRMVRNMPPLTRRVQVGIVISWFAIDLVVLAGLATLISIST